MPTGHFTINGELKLALSGNTARIKNIGMAVNEQQLAVSGRLSNRVKPDIKLMRTAPDLGIDRLLLPDKAARPVSAASADKRYQGVNKPATASKAGKAETLASSESSFSRISRKIPHIGRTMQD